MIVYYLFYNIILEFIVNKSRDFINYANTIFFPNFWTIIQEDQNPIFHIVLLLGNSTVCSPKNDTYCTIHESTFEYSDNTVKKIWTIQQKNTKMLKK